MRQGSDLPADASMCRGGQGAVLPLQQVPLGAVLGVAEPPRGGVGDFAWTNPRGLRGPERKSGADFGPGLRGAVGGIGKNPSHMVKKPRPELGGCP